MKSNEVFCAVTIADELGAIEKIELDEAMVKIYFFYSKQIGIKVFLTSIELDLI